MKLKNLRGTPAFREKMKMSLKRFPKDSTIFYAEIAMNEKGLCPFLNENKMCEMQLEYGYNILSNTCKVFPRMKKVAPNHWEELCTLGCEQTVNLLLERPQGLKLVELYDEKKGSINSEVLAQQLAEEPRMEFYRECQLLFMGILQNRHYSLHHRMLLMGFAARDLDKCKTKEETLAFLQKSLSLLEYDPQMEQTLKEIPIDIEGALQITLMPVLVSEDARLFYLCHDTTFLKMLEDIKTNLSIESKESVDDNDEVEVTLHWNIQKYLEAKKHFEDLEYIDYLMENVMVNTMFQEQFPLKWGKKNESIWEGYLRMCAAYSIFKILTAAYVADKEEQKDVVQGIVCCARVMLHHDTYYNRIMEFLKGYQKDNLIAIAQFLGG